MARTALARRLTDLQRQQQLALRANVLQQVIRAWKTWNIHDEATYVAMKEALVAITEAGASKSVNLAEVYFRMFRAVEQPELARKVIGEVMVGKLPSVEQIHTAIDATAKAGVYNAFKSGKSYEQAMANGLVRVSGATGRLVMNAGRDTIIESVKRDSLALGWERVTSGKPCAFCAMLASRGPVYSEETVDFQAHDHCSCWAEPVYADGGWSEQNKAFDGLWRDAASEFGHAPSIKEWRQFYESRVPEA